MWLEGVENIPFHSHKYSNEAVRSIAWSTLKKLFSFSRVHCFFLQFVVIQSREAENV